MADNANGGSDGAAAKEDASANPLTRAADRIRESAKWLLVSFAAVGATLIAGLSLTSIGDLTNDGPHNRLTWAIVGISLGVLGVVVAIAAASIVVTKSFVTLKWLGEQSQTKQPRRDIEGDTALLGGYETVDQLKSAYDDAMTDRRTKMKASYDDPTDDDKRKAATNARAWAILLGQIVRHVVDQASFERVRASYGLARWGILAGAAISAVGIAAFAWAANPPKSEQVPLVSSTPSDVMARIDPEDRKTFQAKLGTKCDLSRVHAVALGAVGESYQLASVPTDTCKPTVFTLAADQGRVAPVAAAQQPTPTGNPAAPNSG
jgi:hypothetical protein